MASLVGRFGIVVGLAGVLGCSKGDRPSPGPAGAHDGGRASVVDAAADALPFEHAELDEAQRARRQALHDVIDRGGPTAVRALEEATRDPGPLVRVAAAVELGRTHHPRALELLEHLSEDANAAVRVGAADGLGYLSTDGARALLLRRSIGDPYDDVRATAARSLVEIGGAGVEDALRGMAASDPVPQLRAQARDDLEQYLKDHHAERRP